MDEDEKLASLERLNWVCCGNQEAVQFCAMIWDITATYDDLIDLDNPSHSAAHVHSMMYNLMFGLPYNKFYMTNFSLLNPIMLNSVANWRIANEMESQKQDLDIAFIIRSSYIDILRMVAFITGGDAHSIEAGIQLRRYVHQEGLEAYKLEMQGE